MPGRTPYRAVEAFLDPLRHALACLTRTKILVSPGGHEMLDHEHFWTLPGDRGYVDLRGPARLQLSCRMRYMIIRDERPDYGPFRVTTRGYLYSLRTTSRQVVVDYHWHPSGSSHEKTPHLHIGSAQIGRDAVISEAHHLPTGRITVEEIIRMAIKEFEIEPYDENWRDTLDLSETPHKLYRSWPTAGQITPPAFD